MIWHHHLFIHHCLKVSPYKQYSSEKQYSWAQNYSSGIWAIRYDRFKLQEKLKNLHLQLNTIVQGFSVLVLPTFWTRKTVVGSCPVHYRKFNSTPGLYPTRSQYQLLLLSVTTKNISRYCQVSLGSTRASCWKLVP